MAAMEFSYRISEAEYRKVSILEQIGSARSAQFKAVVFWIFILVCLVLLWLVVSRSAPTGPVRISPSVHPVSPPPGSAHGAADWLFTVPAAVVAVLWAFSQSRSRQRNNYQRDPEMQGVFTVNLTTQSISVRNSAGTSFESAWSIFESWWEKLGLILLRRRSGTFLVLNLAGLTEPQRAELRSILADALPQK
jgi:hypothetical protein